MLKFFALFCAASLLSAPVFAQTVELDFEADETDTLEYPGYSGSTTGIEATPTGEPTDVEAYTGTQAYEGHFTWTTISNDQTQALVRITDAGGGRHVLTETTSTDRIGLWIKYDGAAGPMKLAMVVREATHGTYEGTTWTELSGSTEWQHFYWGFTDDIVDDTDASDEGDMNWGQTVGGGGQSYNGDGSLDTSGGQDIELEAVLLRPIEGSTTSGTEVVLFIDHIYTGAPEVTSTQDWELY